MIRIVFVDDEIISLTNAKNLLEGDDIHVDCLRSGEDLLKFIERNTPDLIILDIIMPGMDGFATYKALREIEDAEGRNHIPVIFLTGELESKAEQRGLKIGASDFVHKPFDREIMIRRIRNIISNSKTIEELSEQVMIDKLTGFLNKSHGTDMISKLCRRKTGALMIMDIDNFKHVNDLFGHEMGDKVLCAFSDIVRRNTRQTDTISRIGGDEFLGFYEDMIDEVAVASLSQRLNSQIVAEAERLMGADHGIPIGISTGVVMVPEYGRDYEALFSCVDNALFSVKQNGKHGYSIHGLEREESLYDADEPDNAGKELKRIRRIADERNEGNTPLFVGQESFFTVYRFVKRCSRQFGKESSILMIALSFENGRGKDETKEVASALMRILNSMLSRTGTVMKRGLDRFCVILPGYSDEAAAGLVGNITKEWEATEYGKTAGLQCSHSII